MYENWRTKLTYNTSGAIFRLRSCNLASNGRRRWRWRGSLHYVCSCYVVSASDKNNVFKKAEHNPRRWGIFNDLLSQLEADSVDYCKYDRDLGGGCLRKGVHSCGLLQRYLPMLPVHLLFSSDSMYTLQVLLKSLITGSWQTQGRQSRGSRGSNCSPKDISGGAMLPLHPTGTILYIQSSQRAVDMLAVRNWQ